MKAVDIRARAGVQSASQARLQTNTSYPSVIDIVDELIGNAFTCRASDIHLDPVVGGLRVRLRVDGVLEERPQLPLSVHQEIISRIKVLAGLRTDEHQAAQDGRFRYACRAQSDPVDMRVSIMPTYRGENCVMRLLKNSGADYDLAQLGFSEGDQQKIRAAIQKSGGMILSTGPTGSGKTTTLYTLLRMLNTKEVSIVTIEDPIEYAVDEIEQIQVNARSGLSFANGLRSILRQDPNIIMVGEIRDGETAGIAVNTALTGHLLLSTLHTSDAATTLPRLLDMGIDAYLVASTISVAIGQRLVRKICLHCKGGRCDECLQSGYKGRLCISEALVADTAIRNAIVRKAPPEELRRIAIQNGMTTMQEDGMQKVRAGLTTAEEVLRVMHE